MTELDTDELELSGDLVTEFGGRIPDGRVLGSRCIYRSHAFPRTRWVMQVDAARQSYALKIDTQSPQTGRLTKEFRVLSQLQSHFEGNRTTRVARPVYLSPGGMFLVTEYVDRPTAADLIHNSRDDNQVAQVYRRAGAWLSDLHSAQTPTEYAFRPKWMTDIVEDLTRSAPKNIARTCQSMLTQVLNDAAHLKGEPQSRVFSHGDFHGLNLIMGQGQTIGLDFTETDTKLAVYDMVDFLKSDIFREGPDAEVDSGGILTRNKQMFLRLYRHPVNTEVLDFCLRTRLLIDWLRLSQPDHHCSAHEDHMRTRLYARLQQAFGH